MNDFRGAGNMCYGVDLPGGQNRLCQMIIHVSARCANMPRFGLIKLNKILWKSDFDAFAARGKPVTGRAYQRLALGPAPREMKPVHREMMEEGLITLEVVDFGDGIKEQRTIPLVPADLSLFSPEDIEFVERSIRYYWDLTGMETNDDSHGAAWLTRHNGDPMPYEAALLSDRRPGPAQMRRAHRMMEERRWTTE